MLLALVIAIITAIALGLIGISVLKVIDARNDKNVKLKKDVSQVGASEVMRAGRNPEDVSVSNNETDHNVGETLNKRIVGLIVATAGIFGILATKLASMQLFNQTSYEKAANDNQFKTVNTPAARGLVSDRCGRTLAYSENVQAVVAEKDVSDDTDVMRRLSAILGIPYGIVRKRILDSSSGAQSRRVVSDEASERDIAWVLEHKDGLPGVFV